MSSPSDSINASRGSAFVLRLFKWFKENKRDFPWRRTRYPYEVWLAEVLLQRTRAELVDRVYEDILRKYPNVDVLAKAHLNDIERTIWTLGLLHRSRYLKEGSEYIVKYFGSKFPRDIDSLRKIPGIGKYIGNAILLFAFEQRVPVVDVNVVRVLSRVFSLRSNKSRPHTDPLFSNVLMDLLPKENSRDFTYGMIDFASEICIKKPRCRVCPMTDICSWYADSN